LFIRRRIRTLRSEHSHDWEIEIQKHSIAFVFLSAVCFALVGTTPAIASAKEPPAAGPDAASSGGVVNLTAYSNNDGPNSVVILTGAIGDYGSATRRSSGNASASQPNDLALSLTRGSFVLEISGIESQLGKSIYGKFPTNQSTCSGAVQIEGRAPIVPGSGTGKYAKIRGSFNLTVVINEVESWPKCPKTDTAPYLAQSVFFSGLGVVTLR
jgi:hypothetical protein